MLIQTVPSSLEGLGQLCASTGAVWIINVALKRSKIMFLEVENIFVGKKPVMSYAMSGLIQLGQTGEIVIKGRGMVISRAVDVAQIITERLGKGKYSTKSITLDTDILGEDYDKRNVSTIEIIIGTS